jgi:ureidoglycolate amidohydrolase
MSSLPEITVNAQRVSDELEKLARFSDHDYPAVTRIIFTENDLKARDYFKSLAARRGCTCAKMRSVIFLCG